MAGSHSPASDPEAELNDLECQQLRSQLAKSQQDCWELQEKFLIAEATNFALAMELKKYNCEKFKNIIESILTKKLHLEEPLAEKPTVPELLRHCRGILEDQDQELSQLRPKVQRGRNLAHILQQYLKDVLTVHDPETCTGQGFRRLLTEAVRLSACLEDLLGAENIEEEETPAQGPVADRELLEVDEMETPQNSQQETSITGAVDHLLSDSCLPEGTVQMSPDAEDTHSVLGVDGEHACSQKKEEPVTVLPENQYHEVEVPEKTVTYTSSLIREIPEIEDQDVSQDSHGTRLTPALLPEASDWSHSRSTWSSLEKQPVCSALVVDKNQYHEVEVPEKTVTYTSSLIREIPEIEDQDVSEDSHSTCLSPALLPEASDWSHSRSTWSSLEKQPVCSALVVDKNQYHEVEVPEKTVTYTSSLIREIPEIEDQDVSEDSHELSFVDAPERKTRSQLEGGSSQRSHHQQE
nr:putative neuroblastoma breakpoint family member 5 isoform X13 [Oryctolagus cuniculus]